MRLELDDDQAALAEAAETVLTQECSPQYVRAVFEGEASWRPLYDTVTGLGWQGLAIAEDDGGLGLGPVEVAIVVEALGRHLAPGPFATTVAGFVQAVSLAAGIGQADLLAGVLAGDVTGTVVDGDIRSEAADAGTLHLDGRVQHVLCAADVSHLAVVADDGTTLAVVPAAAAGVSVEAEAAVDPTRGLGTVTLDAVAAAVGPAAPTAAAAEVEAVRELVTCGLAFDALGAAHAAFDMTVAYAKEREQFGRQIGSFQAVKHKLADCYVALTRAGALCAFAALTIAEDDPRRSLAVSMAKAGVGDCQRIVAKESLQIHGGIGYTWEHPLHIHLRRLKTDDALGGSAAFHRRRVADLLGL